MDPAKRPRVVAGNLTGRTVGELSAELQVYADARPGVALRFEHLIVSPARGDVDRLHPDQVKAMLDDFMAGAGYAMCVWVAIEHFDTGTRHYSIIVSTTDAMGVHLASNWKGRSLRSLIRRLEQKYSLQPTHGGNLRRPANKDQIARDHRIGAPSQQDRLRTTIDAAMAEARSEDRSVLAYSRALRARGIAVRYYADASRRVQGISYAYADAAETIAASGTGLGRGYTWPGVQHHGRLTYLPEQHTLELLQSPPPAQERNQPVHPNPSGNGDVAPPGPPKKLEFLAPALTPPASTPTSPPVPTPAPTLERGLALPISVPVREEGREAEEADFRSALLESVEERLELLRLRTHYLGKLSALDPKISELRRGLDWQIGQLSSARTACIHSMRELYADPTEAVRRMEEMIRSAPTSELPINLLITHPEILGAFVPVRRGLFRRIPSSEYVASGLLRHASELRAFAARLQVPNVEEDIRRLQHEKEDVHRQLEAKPFTAAARKQLCRDVQQLKPSQDQWTDWVTRFGPAANTMRREISRSMERSIGLSR